MKLKVALFSIVILTALFMSAFGSPATAQTVKLQDTVIAPEVTVVPPTVVVVTTPGVIPVTGDDDAPAGLWTLVLFGLLGLLAIAFLVALFSPRRTVVHDHDHTVPPHDHEV
jgi:tellurite resistance protein TehA-like permease